MKTELSIEELAINKDYNQLLTKMNPFIYKMSNKYFIGNDHKTELIQVGRIGLFTAMETFDINLSTNFFSWSYTHIKKEMVDYINNNSTTIRIPTYKRRIESNITTISTETPLSYDEGSTTIGDMIPSIEEEQYQQDDAQQLVRALLRQYLSQMKEEYQIILKGVYFEDMSLVELAKQMGVSRQAIEQKHSRGISQLQKLFKVDQVKHEKDKYVYQLKNGSWVATPIINGEKVYLGVYPSKREGLKALQEYNNN